MISLTKMVKLYAEGVNLYPTQFTRGGGREHRDEEHRDEQEDGYQ